MLLSDLSHFSGSETVYRSSLLFPRLVYTEGVRAMAEGFGAYWLIDAIASHIFHGRKRAAIKDSGLTFWTLKVGTRGGPTRATLTARADSTGPTLACQSIEYTDFPAPGITLWAGWTPDVDADGYGIEGSPGRWTLYLPSEH